MNAVQKLQHKREELAAAELALQKAEATFDAEGVIAAKSLIETLRGFITRLEVASATELDAQGATRARAWLAEHAKRTKAWAKEIAVKQADSRRAIAAAVAAIEAETLARQEADRAMLAADLLAQRFALPKPSDSAELPALLDWARDVLDATSKMRPPLRRGVLVPHGASDTPEQVRRSTLRAVAELVARMRRQLPADVMAILDHAPIPPEVTQDAVKPMPEHERRAAREMAEAARIGELASAAVGAGTGLRTL